MNRDELKNKLQNENNVALIKEFIYNNKNYVIALDEKNNYIYFEIENENIKKVTDNAIISYFKEKYETENSTIIY